MEHRFADEPEEAVHALPKGDDVHESFCPFLKQEELVNAVLESQDKAARDDGGNERGKNLRNDRHAPLQGGLILLRGFFTASLETPSMPVIATKSL